MIKFAFLSFKQNVFVLKHSYVNNLRDAINKCIETLGTPFLGYETTILQMFELI